MRPTHVNSVKRNNGQLWGVLDYIISTMGESVFLRIRNRRVFRPRGPHSFQPAVCTVFVIGQEVVWVAIIVAQGRINWDFRKCDGNFSDSVIDRCISRIGSRQMMSGHIPTAARGPSLICTFWNRMQFLLQYNKVGSF